MHKTIFLLRLVMLMIVWTRTGSGDVIITRNGDELTGKIVEVGSGVVRYIPEQSVSGISETIATDSVFMVKYDDGRKQVLAENEINGISRPDVDDRVWSACVFCETGLFGLVNINEEGFDPGVFTIGVTPNIDRSVNRYLSIGADICQSVRSIWYSGQKPITPTIPVS